MNNVREGQGLGATLDRIWDELLETVNEKLDKIEKEGRCSYCSSPVELDRTKDNLSPYWRCMNTSTESCPYAIEFQQAKGNVLWLEELLCGPIVERKQRTMSNTWMVNDSNLVAKSLSEEARTVIADLDYPVKWEIREDGDEFILSVESHMFPALHESLNEQLIILWRHGVRGNLVLYDVDANGFERYTLTDEGVKQQDGKLVFEGRPAWIHHRGGKG